MTTVYDVRHRLTAEVLKAVEGIGNGDCKMPEATAEMIAMSYCTSLGFVAGLRHALAVIEELEKE